MLTLRFPKASEQVAAPAPANFDHDLRKDPPVLSSKMVCPTELGSRKCAAGAGPVVLDNGSVAAWS